MSERKCSGLDFRGCILGDGGLVNRAMKHGVGWWMVVLQGFIIGSREGLGERFAGSICFEVYLARFPC